MSRNWKFSPLKKQPKWSKSESIYSRVPNKCGVFNSSRGRNFLPKLINVGSWIKVGGGMFCKNLYSYEEIFSKLCHSVWNTYLYWDLQLQVICYVLESSLPKMPTFDLQFLLRIQSRVWASNLINIGSQISAKGEEKWPRINKRSPMFIRNSRVYQ